MRDCGAWLDNIFPQAKTVSHDLPRPLCRDDRKWDEPIYPEPPVNPPYPETQTMDKGEIYLRSFELCKKLSISKTTLYRYVKSGKIPKPIELSSNVKVWPASEIDRYLKDIFLKNY